MTEPTAEWKVLPHGPLVPLGSRMLSVVGEIRMPLGTFERRMTIVRLAASYGARPGLVVWSAIALDEAAMRSVEAFGLPTFLVVPNDHHRIDAPAWKARYPNLVVVAPPGARDAVAEALPVDTTAPDFGDSHVQFVTVPGMQGHEAALQVTEPEGLTLILNDVVANIRGESGFGGWLLRMAGFAGDHAHIPAPTRLAMVKDTEALRTQLLAWAGEASLRRIVVSHGAVIEQNPQQVLRELAEALT